MPGDYVEENVCKCKTISIHNITKNIPTPDS